MRIIKQFGQNPQNNKDPKIKTYQKDSVIKKFNEIVNKGIITDKHGKEGIKVLEKFYQVTEVKKTILDKVGKIKRQVINEKIVREEMSINMDNFNIQICETKSLSSCNKYNEGFEKLLANSQGEYINNDISWGDFRVIGLLIKDLDKNKNFVLFFKAFIFDCHENIKNIIEKEEFFADIKKLKSIINDINNEMNDNKSVSI